MLIRILKKRNIIHLYITYLEIKHYIYIRRREAHIAQLGERQTEDLKVMCSIHIVGTKTTWPSG